MEGKIYKIISINTDKIYIGSTTKSLTERLQGHEYNYKQFQNGKHNYVGSYAIILEGNCEIQLLEEIEYKTKKELLEREGYYIQKYKDICVNKNIAGRTYQQYCKDNAEKFREVVKQYRKDNMVKIKEYKNEKLNCVCGGRFTRSNKAQHEKTNMHISFNNQ